MIEMSMGKQDCNRPHACFIYLGFYAFCVVTRINDNALLKLVILNKITIGAYISYDHSCNRNHACSPFLCVRQRTCTDCKTDIT